MAASRLDDFKNSFLSQLPTKCIECPETEATEQVLGKEVPLLTVVFLPVWVITRTVTQAGRNDRDSF